MKKDTKAGLILLGVIIVGVVGGTLVYQTYYGGKIGAKCEEHLGCMRGGVCISHRCQKRCDDDGDCPSGYGCGLLNVNVTQQIAVVFEDKKASTEKICFTHEQLRAARAPAPPPPPPSYNPMQDPIWKKIDVRTKVVVKSIPLAATRPVTVDDASFDKAWNAIPEADQRGATADALADRVLRAMIANQH